MDTDFTVPPPSPGGPHRSRWVPALLLLAAVTAIADGVADAPPLQPVDIQLHHGSDLPWNRPGFRIDIAHWKPHADVSILAVSAGGERIDLTPLPITADGKGRMSLDVDYLRTGLRPGRWTLVVGNPEAPLRVGIDLPEVEWPPGEHPRFKMTYGAPGAQ